MTNRRTRSNHRPYWFIGKDRVTGTWCIFRRFELDENALVAVWPTHADAVGSLLGQMAGWRWR